MIPSIKKNKIGGGYVFHILSDFVSKENHAKLNKLQDELSKFYPCEILIHYVDNAFFKENDIKQWKGSYAAYHRIMLDYFLSNDIKTCLYLDSDMLVLGDLRELWTLDLGDNIFGVCPIDPIQKEIQGQRFNSGFLLFNLKQYRKQNCTQKCLDFIKENKSVYDQFTLNACIKDTLELPFVYNYWFQTFQSDDSDVFALESFMKFKDNVKIIHYIRPKPWMSFYNWLTHSKFRVFIYQNLINLWWDVALETPAFSNELYQVRFQMNNDFAKQMKKFLDDIYPFSDALDSKSYIRKFLKKIKHMAFSPKS